MNDGIRIPSNVNLIAKLHSEIDDNGDANDNTLVSEIVSNIKTVAIPTVTTIAEQIIENHQQPQQKNFHQNHKNQPHRDKFDIVDVNDSTDLVIDTVMSDVAIVANNLITDNTFKAKLYRFLANICTALVYISSVAILATPILPDTARDYITVSLGVIVLLNKGIVSFLHPRRRAATHTSMIPQINQMAIESSNRRESPEQFKNQYMSFTVKVKPDRTIRIT